MSRYRISDSACNLPRPMIPFRSLRHVRTTMMERAGIHSKVASERLGHSRINITLEIYSHVPPAKQTKANDKIEEALRFQGEKKERKRTFGEKDEKHRRG